MNDHFLDQIDQHFDKIKADNNLGEKEIGLRLNSIKQFKSVGIPTRKYEEYKYTNFKPVLDKTYHLHDPSVDVADFSPYLIQHLEGIKLFFENGLLRTDISDLEELKTAVSFDILKGRPNGQEKEEKDPFAVLNQALSINTYRISINRNKIVDKPIIIYNLTNKGNSSPINYLRTLIELEENAELSIIDVFSDLGNNDAFNNFYSEININENARLKYHKIQLESPTTNGVFNTRIKQSKSSTLDHHTYTFNGGMIRNNLNINVDGEGVEANMFGLYLLKGQSHVDNHTTVDHKIANSYSNELYKGIIGDKANGVFNGKIYVRPQAQKTNAFQSNNNILLSDNAVVHTKPQLEIWADDVKCSHGCTTGQLDEDAIFYLQTRGLSKSQAKAFLLEAFANELMGKVKIDALKTFLENKISNSLNQIS